MLAVARRLAAAVALYVPKTTAPEHLAALAAAQRLTLHRHVKVLHGRPASATALTAFYGPLAAAAMEVSSDTAG